MISKWRKKKTSSHFLATFSIAMIFFHCPAGMLLLVALYPPLDILWWYIYIDASLYSHHSLICQIVRYQSMFIILLCTYCVTILRYTVHLFLIIVFSSITYIFFTYSSMDDLQRMAIYIYLYSSITYIYFTYNLYILYILFKNGAFSKTQAFLPGVYVTRSRCKVLRSVDVVNPSPGDIIKEFKAHPLGTAAGAGTRRVFLYVYVCRHIISICLQIDGILFYIYIYRIYGSL